MAQNVLFKFGTRAQFDAIVTKNEATLYWLTDTQELYKGNVLFGKGALASETASGLLSAEDYKKLQELIVTGGTVDLTPVDGTIVIEDKKIGVAISTQDGNALVAVEGGLFVPTVTVPEYAIEKQEAAEEGYAVSYKLKKTVGDTSSYVGDVINVPKDLVLKSATLETVDEADKPYTGAAVGDPYIHMVFNDAAASDIYVPVKGLVDTYTAGSGIEIVDNVVGVKIAENAHGLVAVEGGLTLTLATTTSDGAMSAADKAFIDFIPSTYASRAEMNAIAQRVKYEVFSKPAGTTAKVMDNEIRICCAADTAWTEQAVGSNGNPDRFYIGLKIYAPIGADHFMEDLKKTIEDTTVFDFTDEFSGRDSYGNGYSLVWLPVAAKQVDGTWKYYGDGSTADKMIGWYYTSAFYDASDNLLSKETIRINLVNENMDTETIPYYMNNYATKEALESLENNISWGEL